MARHVASNISFADPVTVSALDAALHGGTPPHQFEAFIRSAPDSDSDTETEGPLVAPGHAVNVADRPRNIPMSAHLRSGKSASTALYPLSRSNPPSPAQSSTSSSSSVGSQVVRPTILCTVLPVRRKLEILERISSDSSRKFRVRDPTSGAKLFSIDRGESGPCVRCSSGAVLWSVLPYSHGGTESARGRILHKNGSSFFVVMAAHRWAPRIERRAYGHLHALPHIKRTPELALEVRADSLGKRFQVFGRDSSSNTRHVITSGKRSTRFQKVKEGGVREVAVWEVDVEANVDAAMMSAMVVVLNEWEVRPPATS